MEFDIRTNEYSLNGSLFIGYLLRKYQNFRIWKSFPMSMNHRSGSHKRKLELLPQGANRADTWEDKEGSGIDICSTTEQSDTAKEFPQSHEDE